MMASSLSLSQRRILDIIFQVRFGHVRGLQVRGGQPDFEKPPRIVQEIMFSSVCEPRSGGAIADFRLTKENEDFFSQLKRIGDGEVDIDVKHGAPFRIVIDRGLGEFQP